MRRILESAGRGWRASLANPGLVLAPIAVAVSTVVSFAAPLLALLAYAWRDLPSPAEATPERVLLALTGPLQELVRSPGLLVAALILLTVLVTVLFAAAAFARAGLFGVLVRADLQAPARASRSSFRVTPGVRAFLAAGGRFGWRFFWILNFYALAVFVVLMPLLLGLVLLLIGIPSGHLLPGLVVLLAGLPIAFAGAVALRLWQLGTERETLARNLTVGEGVASGLRLLRLSLPRSLGLFALFMAAGMAVGGVLGAPRILLLVAFRGHSPLATGAGVLLALLQTLVVCALEVVSTASFVALWGENA